MDSRHHRPALHHRPAVFSRLSPLGCSVARQSLDQHGGPIAAGIGSRLPFDHGVRVGIRRPWIPTAHSYRTTHKNPHNFCNLFGFSFDRKGGDEVPDLSTAEGWRNAYPSLFRAALRAAEKASASPDHYLDAEDVALEAMAALARKDAGGETIDNPTAFVIVVAQRRMTDRVRRLHRWQLLVESGVLTIIQATNPDEEIDPHEVERRLDQGLERMSERQRQCFKMHYIGGLSEEEIATVLGVQVTTVKTHLVRARAVFKQEIR